MNKIKLKRGFYLEVQKCNEDGLLKYYLRKKRFLQETIFYNMWFLDIESAEDYIKYLKWIMDLDLNSIVEFNPQEDYTEEEKAEIVANYINILRQSRINQMEHMITTINMLLTLDDVDAIHTILEKVRSSYIKTIIEDIKDKS